MYRLDLHSHSILSRDGSLTINDYKTVLKKRLLDYIAITDHNDILLAQQAQNIIGDQIIIGEEIMTNVGEIIGLYLTEKINPAMSLKDSIEAIKSQNGLVYVPHPFDNLRHGLTKKDILANLHNVDILECYNSRSLQINNRKINFSWAEKNNLLAVASSDAHGKIGFGKTNTMVQEKPARDNLLYLLKEAKFNCYPSNIIARLYPTLNRIRSKNRHA